MSSSQFFTTGGLALPTHPQHSSNNQTTLQIRQGGNITETQQHSVHSPTTLGILESNVQQSLQPLHFIRTETDFDLLSALQPLVTEHKAYICMLEEELGASHARIRALERQVERADKEYEGEIQSVRDKYREQMEKHEGLEQRFEMQMKMIRVEREDIRRMQTLYKTANDTLETINRKLLQQVEQQDMSLKKKDQAIKEVREDSIQQIRVNNQITEQLEESRAEIENLKMLTSTQAEKISSLTQSLNQADVIIVELKNESRLLSSRLQATEATYEDLTRSKRYEIEQLQDELQKYKNSYHQSQSQLAKLTSDYDTLRGERLTLQTQLRESKHDCEVMSKLLEDLELKSKTEKPEQQNDDFKSRAAEMKVQEERLRLLIQQNEILKADFEAKQEQDDRRLEKRVERVLESERKLAKEELSSREREINQVRELLMTYETENNRLKADQLSLQTELKETKQRLQLFSEETVLLQHQHSVQLDQLRRDYDDTVSQKQSEVASLTEQLSDLSHAHETATLSLAHFQSRTQDLVQELSLREDDYARFRAKHEQSVREKELIEAKLGKEVRHWRERAEEIAEYSEEQVSKYGEREQKRKNEMREASGKAWEALVKQERMAERWRQELTQTVEAYEAQMKKLRKECRGLKNQLNAIMIQTQKEEILSTQSNSPELSEV